VANFDSAIQVILKHEGGLVDDPKDPGGITNYGISFRFLKDHAIDIDQDGDVDADDIRKLTPEQAMDVYKKYFWTPEHCAAITDDTAATKLFDMCVNMGLPRAARIAQAAAVALGKTIDVDGQLGPKSLEALNDCKGDELVKKMCEGQAQAYHDIVAARPASQKFLAGWLRRAAWPH
jgi:lysozyme family protein